MPEPSAGQSSRVVASPDYLDRAIQRELAALAALDAAHRAACDWLTAWSGPEDIKARLACHVEARYRAERESHVLHLAELHQHRTALTASEA